MGFTSKGSPNHRSEQYILLVCGWESAHEEGQLYAPFYTVSYGRLEHPWLLVPRRGTGNILYEYQGMTVIDEKFFGISYKVSVIKRYYNYCKKLNQYHTKSIL